MIYFRFLPLASFAGIALMVAMVSGYVELAERRRARRRQRRMPAFRPVVIRGGRMDGAVVAAAAARNAEAAAREQGLRLVSLISTAE